MIKLCCLPIISTFTVKLFGFLQSSDFLYAVDKNEDFIVWRISEPFDGLKKEIDEMIFAVKDKNDNLLTYTEENGGESGKVIYCPNKQLNKERKIEIKTFTSD